MPQELDSIAPNFKLVSVDGDTVSLPRPGVPTLFIACSTTCAYCERSIPAWQRVAESICSVDIVIAAATTDELLASHWQGRAIAGCANVIIGNVLEPEGVSTDYRISGTPRHYLIAADGTFRQAWYGMVEGRRSIRRFLAGLIAASEPALRAAVDRMLEE